MMQQSQRGQRGQQQELGKAFAGEVDLAAVYSSVSESESSNRNGHSSSSSRTGSAIPPPGVNEETTGPGMELAEVQFDHMVLQWSDFTNLHELQHLEEMIQTQPQADYYNEQQQQPPRQHSISEQNGNGNGIGSGLFSQNTPELFYMYSSADAAKQHQSHNHSDQRGQPQSSAEESLVPPAGAGAGSGASVQPNDVFTPLISPAVTPLDKAQAGHAPSFQKKVGFSPLTSPALEFQAGRYASQANSASSLRQKRKDEQVTNVMPSHTNDDNSRRSSYKRSKTPVTTPLVGPSNPVAGSQTGRIKQSPVIRPTSGSVSSQSSPANWMSFTKTKKKPKTPAQTGSQTGFFDMLPESATSNDNMMPPPARSIKKEEHEQEEKPEQLLSMDTESDGEKESDEHSHSVATPATLMSFSMSTTSTKKKDSVFLNPRHDAKSAQSSPVILPSSNPLLITEQHHQIVPQVALPAPQMSSRNSSRNSSLKTSPVIKHEDYAEPSVSEHYDHGTPYLQRNNSVSSVKSNHTDKKVNHKLAEQGRRNRMNIAIQELDKIIPDAMKDDKLVPSKATTVELSSKFIGILQDENAELRGQLERAQQELVRLRGRRATTDTHSSISPLEYDEGQK